ncbi:putative phosphatidylglycerol/phosphatidylinositol transfer protein isoform C [Glycine soja]|uniref:Putative phosphatidylglycerol/phosphatidylinositol transfer protein isoform B n=1 Tax=Glycine soja TaxID=3848 RepID=A0A445ICF6_GLYSO|nr:putative phosphatidylglycerol/phosphatidylinositol transfer protein isoform B [Glycine soja]RZB83720.1 putative phosphatidylglycerol/phosphatidylinositol transfer protein isoform C [Glycine soja]
MEFQFQPKLNHLLCLFILILSSVHAQATSFRYCADVNYAVKVSGIQITPDPVVRSRPATFKISAATGETIYGGKWLTTVAYFGFVVHTEIHDFCEEISCPVATGSFVASHTQKLPAFAPPVSFNLPNISLVMKPIYKLHPIMKRSLL